MSLWNLNPISRDISFRKECVGANKGNQYLKMIEENKLKANNFINFETGGDEFERAEMFKEINITLLESQKP